MPKSFRTGFYAGAFLALIMGIYLARLWGPGRQIELHTNHLLRSLETRDWQRFSALLAPDYRDQWDQDGPTVLARSRQVFSYLRGIELRPIEPVIESSGRNGSWQAQIELIGAENNELAGMVRDRLKNVHTPFRLEWRRESRKPWDWRLLRVSNEELNLPEGNVF
jgi:hypothetical protein